MPGFLRKCDPGMGKISKQLNVPQVPFWSLIGDGHSAVAAAQMALVSVSGVLVLYPFLLHKDKLYTKVYKEFARG